ncbi:MAG: DUF4358 domain-containing protein [Clostridia bacterium]|nr:DUF4358 domain-containing protein [Clostridia bacterium]
MKRFCFLLIALLLLLPSCGRRADELSLAKATDMVLTEYGDNASFVRADGDFITTNFGNREDVAESAVYFSESGDGTEFGFFRMSDAAHCGDMESDVRAYIASERQSVESLAALYPADDLNARLKRFDNATVGTVGNIVYYFITEPTIAKNAVRRFRG